MSVTSDNNTPNYVTLPDPKDLVINGDLQSIMYKESEIEKKKARIFLAQRMLNKTKS